MTADGLNLDAYLQRIGCPPLRGATLATLRTVIAHHAAAIPFENLDVVLNRPINVDLASVEGKLVHQRRGGYCFEQNTLLRAALDALGFRTAMLMARVVYGADEAEERPRTHAFVRVTLPEGDYLADCGFGNATPTQPLRLGVPDAQATQHESYRLQPRAAEQALQCHLPFGWHTIYRFTAEPTLPIDHVVGSWFCSTHPGLFTGNLIVAAAGDGVRKTLLNGRFTVRQIAGDKSSRMITDASDLRETLRSQFGLEITLAEGDTLCQRMAAFQGEPLPT